MGFERKVLAIMQKEEEKRRNKGPIDVKALNTMQYCEWEVSKKILNRFNFNQDFNKDARKVIEKLKKQEKDLKALKNYGNFWNKRNKKLIQDTLRPCLSHDALVTLPYIEDDPQVSARKKPSKIMGFNDSVEENLQTLFDMNTSKSRTSRNVTKFPEFNTYIPSVQESIHVLKNGGDYYVQESLAKSHSPLYKINYRDIVKARDIFTDKYGNINIRAAKESVQKELPKSVIHMMKVNGKKKRLKREKHFKQLKSQSKAMELKRILENTSKFDTVCNTTRNYQPSFTLPHINLNFKTNVPKDAESKEIVLASSNINKCNFL